MSSLSSTVEEILDLVEGPRVHHDPKVCREILRTDIENAIYSSGLVAELRKQILDLDYEKRQHQTNIEDLEFEIEVLEDKVFELEKHT